MRHTATCGHYLNVLLLLLPNVSGDIHRGNFQQFTALTRPMSGTVLASARTSEQKLGLIGWIEGRPQTAFGLFLSLHFVVWTALPALLYANLPMDVIEALIYGREWQLGYDKLPPLPWWLVEIAHRAFGVDAAYYGLAQAAVIAAFAAVWATARPLVGTTGALVAVLIIDGMHYFQSTAVQFNHNVVELPFWALAGYAFHAALKRGRIAHWLLLGLAIGGALWAKYFIVMLAIPYALFLLFDRDARRALATPGPWIALAFALAVIAPHLVWLFQNDFSPLTYAAERAAPPKSWFGHISNPAIFVGGQVFFLLPSLLIAAAMLWPRSAARQEVSADLFDRRIVTLIAFGPGVTMIAFTALSGRGTVAMWGYPLWLYLGLWIVLTARVLLDRARLIRVVASWGAVFAIFVVAFITDNTVLPLVDHHRHAALYPGQQIAAELTLRFRTATGQPLRYVIASMKDGGNIAHYSPDRPRVLIDGDPRRAPWIDLNDLRAKGAVVVWTGEEPPYVFNPEQIPVQFAAMAADAEVGAPLTLPMRWGPGEIHVGWAILKPR